MQRWLCFMLVVTLLLSIMTGCNGDGSGTSTEKPTGETNPSASEPQVNIAPTPPADPQNPVTEYDPEREIFLLCGRNDMTFYRKHGYVRNYLFYIFSKDALEESEIDVSVQLETAYTLDVRELALTGIKQEEELSVFCLYPETYMVEQFPYWLYAAYRGMDFAELYRLQEVSNNANAAYEEGVGTLEESIRAQEVYWEFFRQYETDYATLTEEELPQFHVYQVMLDFDINIVQGTDYVDESFSSIDVTIGDQVYHEEVGEIRLQPERQLPAELDWYIWESSVDDGVLGYARGPLPFNDGENRIDMYFSFRAEGNITLTDLILEEPGQTLQKVWVNIITADGFVSTVDWDRKTPIEIYESDLVTVDITYREEGMERMGYNAKVWGYLLYDYEGKTYCKLSESHLTRQYNYYEIYAMVFDGLDLEGYYREFYYPVKEN